jgi:protein O-mannosyl-transferase
MAAEAPTKRTMLLVAVVCGSLVLAVTMVFGRTVTYDFVDYDDPIYVSDNPELARGLGADGIAWAFTATRCANWHPLTWLSLLADHELFGAESWGYHLGNVVLHAATAVLLFLVLWRMTADFWPSAFVAAVFVIHPLRVESVAWVAERKDVLSGLFFMLTLAAYVGYIRRPFSLVRYLAVAALFALGLMAKPMLVTLPFVLLLLDYWPLGRLARPAKGKQKDAHSWGGSCAATPGATVQLSPQRVGNCRSPWQLLVEKLPLLALSAASCVVTILAQRESVATLDSLSLASRTANALVSYIWYVVQFFCPTGLAVLYPYPSGGLPIRQVASAFLVLSVVTAGVVVCRRRWPWLLVGWLWYLGMLVPVIGLVQVGGQSMADRYTYLPQIGLTLGLAWAAKRALVSWPYRGWLYGVTAALVLAGLMGCAWHQTSFWHDSTMLWRRSADCTLRNARAHANLASALARDGQLDEAIVHFTKSLEIRGDLADVYCNFGVALARRGRIDEAIARYEQALKLKPDDVLVHNSMGKALFDQGRFDEAIGQYEKVLEIKPDCPEAYYNLGLALAGRGQVNEAITYYQKALEIKPDFAEAHSGLGIALADSGRLDDAIAHFRKALEIRPDLPGARENLAHALRLKGPAE